jgi:putative heme-binding domain-containing protein
LPDDTVAGLKEVYQNNAVAKKGPIFKIKVKQIPLTEYQSFALAHPGDCRLGQKIFSNVNGVNCIRCHTIKGQGALIGPDLTGISTKQDRAQIIESVLFPSKLILDGYQQVLFKMTDDDDYSGIVRTETPDTVTVIDSLGMTNLLQKSKIKTRKISQISLMPEGLQTGLSLKEFSDLIAFLENPNPSTQMASVSQPADPTDFLNLPPLPIEMPAASEPPVEHATPPPSAPPASEALVPPAPAVPRPKLSRHPSHPLPPMPDSPP